MICTRCSIDKTVVVTIAFAITKIDRNSKEKRVQIERSLCRACGGGAEPMEDEPTVEQVAASEDEHEQIEMEQSR